MSDQAQEVMVQACGPDYIYTVEFNTDDYTLDYDFSDLVIPAGVNILWQINNLPRHWTTYIEFIDAELGQSHGFLGPFEQLLMTDRGLLGLNSSTSDTRWKFRLLAQRGLASFGVDEATAIIGPSRSMSIDGQSETIEVCVTVSDENEDELEVYPEHVTLRPGRRILWNFTDVINKRYGVQPFVCYGNRPITAGSAEVPVYACGPLGGFQHWQGYVLGYGNTNIKGIYSYEVYALELGSRSISLMSSGDPQTDNEGESSSTGGQ